MAVEPRVEAEVLGGGEGGLARPAIADHGRRAAAERRQQGLHAPVIRIVGLRPLGRLDHEVGRAGALALGAAPVHPRERVALEGRGDVDRLVAGEKTPPGFVEIGRLDQVIDISAAIGGGKQRRAERMGDRMPDESELIHSGAV